MTTAYTIKEAAEELGMTTAGVRYRMKTGDIKAKRKGNRWVVYLNGDERASERPVPELKKVAEGNDPLTEIGNELITLGRRLKRAIKEHDAEVRRETIIDFAASIAEAAERGR